MSQQVHVNPDTDVHFTGVPDLPHDELEKKIKDYLQSKKLKAKVVFAALVKLVTPGELIVRLSSSSAVWTATEAKVKFIKVGHDRKTVQAVRASSSVSYQANSVPPVFQALADSSDSGPPNNTAHNTAASGSAQLGPAASNPTQTTPAPGVAAQTTPVAPTNPSSSANNTTPSQPTLAERLKPKDDPEPEPNLFITANSTKKRIDGPNLNAVFHQPGLNNQAPMTKVLQRDIIEPYEFENETPPRFKLKSAAKVQEAIMKYNGATVDKYGQLEIKEWFEPPVTVSASDGTPEMTPAPRPEPKVVLKTMQKGPLKFANYVDNPLKFTDEIRPERGNSDQVIANYVHITEWPEKIYEYGINIEDVDLEPGPKGEKRTRRIGRLNEKKSIIETLSENWPLTGKRWATDYETLWVLEPLWGHTGTLEILDVGKIRFYKNDGRTDEHAPRVELTYIRNLNLPVPDQTHAFAFADGHDFRERTIQALNAFVARHVGMDGEGASAANQPLVKQIAPNKFYAPQYFNELNAPKSRSNGGNTRGGGFGGSARRGAPRSGGGGRNARSGFRSGGPSNFRGSGQGGQGGHSRGEDDNDGEAQRNFTRTFLAYRGFRTSIRPTADSLLLGIAPLTSAFFRPITVQDWLDRLSQPDAGFSYSDDRLKTLVGIRCRLVHNRVRHNHGDPDPNDERHRYKVITEFGDDMLDHYGQPLQMYQPRTPPNATVTPALQTVASCFTNLLAADLNLGNTICVNVGAKLKFKPKHKDDQEKNLIKRLEHPNRYENFEKALWIPAKLLEIEPMQLYSKVLSGNYQFNMIDVACKTPHLNRAWLEGPGFDFLGIQRASIPQQVSQAPWMRNVQLSIRGSLLRVDATFRRLPTIHYGNNLTLQQGSEGYRDASWNLEDVQFRDTADVPALCFIRLVGRHRGRYYNGKREENRRTLQLFNLLVQQFGVHGITSPIAKERFLEWEIDIGAVEDEGKVTTKIDDEFWAISQAVHHGVEYPTEPRLQQIPNTLFVIILPQKDPANLFQSTKRAADQNGLHNICVTSDKIEGPKFANEQYVSNLCLKINAKAAKDVHRLAYFSTSTQMKNTIVLGADIGTVKGGPAGCPSIAAVVGSVDREHMIAPGSMRLIPAKQDTIPFESMRDMVYERFRDWFHKHGSLPANVLMYRDGVSQSQYASLLEKADGTFYDKPAKLVDSFKPYENEHKKKKQRAAQDGEVAAIYEAYGLAASKLDPNNVGKPKLTFVVVGKRHNTRFFPQNQNQSITFRDNGNLKPGAVIQTGCTLPNEWPVVDNFFLLSHAAIKGTGRPAHYVVLRDEMGLSSHTAGKPLHEITHNLCFAYTRATKGVSYCAPAYHADRLCTRGQDYLKRIMHDLSESEDWWGTKMPEPTKQNPAPAEGWYQTIADEVSRHIWWNPDPQNRGNSWHWTLDSSMFWI